MGDAADDLDHQRFMALNPIDRPSYKCGYCGLNFGIYNDACKKHVEDCEGKVQS